LRLVPSLHTQALSSFLVVLKTDYSRGEEAEGVFGLWLQDRPFFLLSCFFPSFYVFSGTGESCKETLGGRFSGSETQ
jgi:hypothetical protein